MEKSPIGSHVFGRLVRLTKADFVPHYLSTASQVTPSQPGHLQLQKWNHIGKIEEQGKITH